MGLALNMVDVDGISYSDIVKTARAQDSASAQFLACKLPSLIKRQVLECQMRI